MRLYVFLLLSGSRNVKRSTSKPCLFVNTEYVRENGLGHDLNVPSMNNCVAVFKISTLRFVPNPRMRSAAPSFTSAEGFLLAVMSAMPEPPVHMVASAKSNTTRHSTGAHTCHPQTAQRAANISLNSTTNTPLAFLECQPEIQHRPTSPNTILSYRMMVLPFPDRYISETHSNSMT